MKCLTPHVGAIQRSPLFQAVTRKLSEYVKDETTYKTAGIYSRRWRLDLCRDGTLSIRRKGQVAINDGRSIPVFSVDKKADALRLQGELRALLNVAVLNAERDRG